VSETAPFGFKGFSYEKYLREEPYLKVLTPEKTREYYQSEKGQLLSGIEQRSRFRGVDGNSSFALRELEDAAKRVERNPTDVKVRELYIKQFFEYGGYAIKHADELLNDTKLELNKTEKEAVKALRKDILRDMSRVGTVATIGRK